VYGPAITIDEDSEDEDEEEETIPGYPNDDSHRYNLIPVYDVEWVETDDNFIM